MSSPIILHLYNPETQEEEKSYSAVFIPWKVLKRAIRLNKTLGNKSETEYEEANIDEIASLVIAIFGNGLTTEMLDEQSDINEMMAVVRSIVSRARGIMDPTLPSKT